MGNICRSPLAQGIGQARAKQLNLNLYFDSAGTSNYHAGSRPDSRSIAIAKKHAIDISEQISRPITLEDFSVFDYIIAMDRQNLQDLRSLAPQYQHKIHLLLDFAPEVFPKNIPDPYFYRDGFQLIYDLIDNAVGHFLKQLSK